MSVAEILKQAETLSPQERQYLVQELLAMGDAAAPAKMNTPKTGAEIVALLETMDPIELIYPEITDPVEWVKQIRLDQQKKRGLYDNGDDE